LKILKEYGCNAIRCSHNPPSPEFLDICDSLGFVVIDEIYDKWKTEGAFYGYYTPYFDEWWKREIDAMLLCDRNHPSIIMWSLGNETSEQNDTTGVGTARANMLQNYVNEEEPTSCNCCHCPG
jgi:beta-galactosidase